MLKPTTIRFSEDSHSLIQSATEHVGTQFSQFVREAAIMRALLVLSSDADLSKLALEVLRLQRLDGAQALRLLHEHEQGVPKSVPQD